MKKTTVTLLASTTLLASSLAFTVPVHATSLQSITSVHFYKLPKVHSGMPFTDSKTNAYKTYIGDMYDLDVETGTSSTKFSPNGTVNRGQMANYLYRLAGSPSFTPTATHTKYITDISKSAYKKNILWLEATGITTGHTFHPTQNVTREQFAAFLHRFAIVTGKAPKTKTYTTKFKDISKSAYKNDINWLSTISDIPGASSTKFNPKSNVTRGQMAAFLDNFYKNMQLFALSLLTKP